jgi:hypothetical protein
MVKDAGAQFRFLSTGSFEETVIDDEHILTIFAGQIPDGLVDDPS